MKKNKIILMIALIALNYKLLAQVSGSLDTTFGVNGKVMTDFSPISTSDNLEDLLLQPDGKIIAVGWFHTNTTTNYSELAIVRYLTNGTIDSTFGLNGKLIYNLTQNGWRGEYIRSAVLQSDGKIICTGGVDGTTSIETVVTRFLADGQIDSLFGNNGIVTIDFISNNPDEGSCIVTQSDGKIVVGIREGGVVRFNSNGSIDSTFGNNGIINTNQAVQKIAIQTDEKILVAGEYNPQNPWWWYFGIVRFDGTGIIDSTFGTNGRTFFDHSNIVGSNFWSTRINALDIQPDGKILIAGGCEDMNSSTDTRFAMGRLNTDGTLDISNFGIDGRIVVDFPGDFERIHDITIQPDGKIFFIGEANNSDFAIVRTNADGNLDTSFNNTGKLLIDFAGVWEYGYASLLQSNGKLLVGGPAINDSGNYDFTLIRLNNNLNVGIIDFDNNYSNILFYPNPIGQNSTLKYSLKKDDLISIQLFDRQGRKIRTFINNQIQQKGLHQQLITFPDELASGSYLIVITSPRGQMSVEIIK